jgi:hypothetical protein
VHSTLGAFCTTGGVHCVSETQGRGVARQLPRNEISEDALWPMTSVASTLKWHTASSWPRAVFLAATPRPEVLGGAQEKY